MDTKTSLLHHIRTTQEADILLAKIEEMLDALYQLNQPGFTQIFAGELPSTLSKALQDAMSHEGITFAKSTEMKDFLTGLKQLLQTTTILTLTISFPPSDEAISAIAAKAKELYGAQTILEINVQESILGGAMIIMNGKYLDYSLQTRLSNVFKTMSKDILSVISGSSPSQPMPVDAQQAPTTGH
jgi:hypothetical protein